MYNRLKYVLWFCISLISGFFTFQAFMLFNSAGALNSYVVFLNTVVLFVAWFFVFTSQSDFVRDNALLIIIIPLLAIYLNDLYFTLYSAEILFTDFILFVAASSMLMIATWRTKTNEKILQSNQ